MKRNRLALCLAPVLILGTSCSTSKVSPDKIAATDRGPSGTLTCEEFNGLSADAKLSQLFDRHMQSASQVLKKSNLPPKTWNELETSRLPENAALNVSPEEN